VESDYAASRRNRRVARKLHARGHRERAGHRTDEASVRANAWMFAQLLATGVTVSYCATRTLPAARAFLAAVRFPIHKQGVDRGIKRRVIERTGPRAIANGTRLLFT